MKQNAAARQSRSSVPLGQMLYLKDYLPAQPTKPHTRWEHTPGIPEWLGEHLDGALVHGGDDGVERGLDVVLYGVYMKGKNEKDLSPDSNPFLQTANPCCDPLGRAIAQPHNRGKLRPYNVP